MIVAITRHLFAVPSLIGLLAVPVLAQTPLPGGVQRGVPRQLLPLRSDAQLLSLLTSARNRTYTVYTFELKGSIDHASVRRWNGALVMPRPADLGTLGPVTVTGTKGEKLSETWYKHPDGTISMVLVNRSGAPIGVISMRELSMWAQLDLDRDGVVDFLRSISLDGHEVVAAASEGLAFLREWRQGQNPLCEAKPAKAVTDLSAPSPERDKASFLGAAGTMPACVGERSAGGALGGIIPREKADTRSPEDIVCAGRTGSVSSLGINPQAVMGAIIGVGSTFPVSRSGGTERPPPPDLAARDRERMAGRVAEFVYTTILKPDKPREPRHPRDATVEESREGSRESPTVGSEGARGGDAEAALNAVCAARARAQRHWSVTHDALNRTKTDAAGTDCDDPVTDPASAEAENTMPKCGPSRSTQSVGQQLLAGLGAYQSRQCGRTENPGPDGTCRGSRNIGSTRGRAWYGYGSIIGLVPCDPRTCDPAER